MKEEHTGMQFGNLLRIIIQIYLSTYEGGLTSIFNKKALPVKCYEV